jgi:hypothetical protein
MTKAHVAFDKVDRGFEHRSGDQHSDFHSASSLKQQSAGRHVASLGHIILIPSQSLLLLLNVACFAETTNTKFDLLGLEPKIQSTRCEHGNLCPIDTVVIYLIHINIIYVWSSPFYQNVTCSRHDIDENCTFGVKQQSLK